MGERLLERFVPSVWEAIARSLDGESQLRSMARYHLGLSDAQGQPTQDGGKLVRPSLLLFTANELGIPVERAMPAAVGLELIHSFSLLHDDIQDGDRVRRGRAAAWTLWGVPQAINAGDLLHALAVKEALRAGLEVAQTLIAATEEMIEGQSDDLSMEKRRVPLTSYMRMIDKKTGALITAALAMPGVLAEADARLLETLQTLGRCIGRAFQIQDDLLGVWGDEAELGKPSGSDIRRRKNAYPIVLAFERAVGTDRQLLETTYAEEGPVQDDRTEEIVQLMTRLGIREAGHDELRNTLRHAEAAVDALPFSEDGRSEMRDFLGYLGRRER